MLTGTKKSSLNYSSAFQLILPSLSLTGAMPVANSSSILSYFSSFTLPSNAAVMEYAIATETALVADDVTGIGVADDILIPVIFAGTVIYVIINSDLDRGNVSADSRESFPTYKPDDSGIYKPLEAAIPLSNRMDNFAQRGKNNGKADDIGALKAKQEAGTLTNLEKQKLKRHEKIQVIGVPDKVKTKKIRYEFSRFNRITYDEANEKIFFICNEKIKLSPNEIAIILTLEEKELVNTFLYEYSLFEQEDFKFVENLST